MPPPLTPGWPFQYYADSEMKQMKGSLDLHLLEQDVEHTPGSVDFAIVVDGKKTSFRGPNEDEVKRWVTLFGAYRQRNECEDCSTEVECPTHLSTAFTGYARAGKTDEESDEER